MSAVPVWWFGGKFVILWSKAHAIPIIGTFCYWFVTHSKLRRAFLLILSELCGVVYISLYYIDFILMYNLLEDLKAYETLLRGTVNSWESIGALGLQGIGSNCMYAMGMLVGAYVIRFVPEVASWLIPGGVSSSAGSAAGSVVAGMAGGAVARGTSAAGTVVSVAAPVAGSAATVAAKTGAAGLGGAVAGARGTSDGGGGTLAGAVGGAAVGMARQMGSSFSNSSAGKSAKGAYGSMKDAYNRGNK